MIDLHCHMLPADDHDHADPGLALEMARIALDDGIRHSVCAPQPAPGHSPQDASRTRSATKRFAAALDQAGLPLRVSPGAALQLEPELLPGLRQGRLPTLADSRYYLLELPSTAAPGGFSKTIATSLAAGYVPVIAHPEQLDWLNESHYHRLVQAARQGAWLMVTAGAVTGRFGATARGWAERLLDDGLVHLLASDAHDSDRHPPLLSAGRDAAACWVGADEADRLVRERPAAIIANLTPGQVTPPPALASLHARHGRPTHRASGTGQATVWLGRLFGLPLATR